MAASLLPSNKPKMCAKIVILLLLQFVLPIVVSQESFEEYTSSDDEEEYHGSGWSYDFPSVEVSWFTESSSIPLRAWLSELMDLSIWESSWWTQFSFWEPPSTSTSSVSPSSNQYSSYYDNSDICDSNPCDNGGSCEPDGDWIKCWCRLGYTGDYCDIADPCYPNPCYNGGECIGVITDDLSYCVCESLWTGQRCEIAVLPYDPCSCNPCLNGGTCESSPTTYDYTCHCPKAFTGRHCQTEVSDPCSPDPCDFGYCQHNATTRGGYWCECFEGYNGTRCQHDYLPPAIYCEAGLSYQIALYEGSKAVYWELPDAYDNSEEYANVDLTVWCTPPSGTYFTEGQRKVECKAIDESGNVANCSFDVLITRDEVPEINCIGDIRRSAETGQSYAVVDYPDPSVFNAETYSCWPAAGSNFRIGETVVSCQAWKAGVSDRCNFIVHVLDFQKPIITCPDDKEVNTAYQANYNQVWWTQPQASDNSGQVHKWCDPDPGSIMYLGANFVVCYAEDAHGNQQSCSFSVAVLDNERPSISCPGRKVRSMEWDTDSAEIWFLGEVQAWDNSEEQPVIECKPREGYFPIGETEVTCNARDQADNIRSCTFEIQVYDNQPPTIVCPSNIFAKRPQDEDGTQVEWSLQAWDNTEDDLNTGCSPNQKHTFQYGTTTVSCVTADASGNRGFCQFNVEVTDYDVPEITCPDEIELETLPNQDYNEARWNPPTYIVTNDQQGFISCDFDSGSEFKIGTHMVECVITLDNDVSSGCSFFVTIVDNEPPTISCPTNQIVLFEVGDTITPSSFDIPTYRDNSGEVDMYCNPNLDTELVIGIWQMSCFAIDRSGNRNSCTFGVNVVPVIADPVDPCEGEMNQCNDNGICVTTSIASKRYTCNCFEGWSGQFCQETDYDDPCEGPGPDGDYLQCNGRGTCITTDITQGEYRCECMEGWTGERCQDYDDPCEGPGPDGDYQRCNGRGTCITTDNTQGEYRCECIEGWTGERCQDEEEGSGNGPAEHTTPVGVSGGVNGGGDGDVNGGENSAQSGLQTGVLIGASSGGLLLIIIILVAIIVFFVLKGRRSKPAGGTLSTHPLAATSSNTQAKDKEGLENPNYSTSIDRYALPSPSAPPPNMPPPAYTPTVNPGKKIPPRLPSMNPSAIYQGGSVVYNSGGSTTTYGAYERPDGASLPQQHADASQVYDNNLYDRNIYEEIPEDRLNPPEYDNADYLDLQTS